MTTADNRAPPRRTPQQERSRTLASAVMTAVEQLLDRVEDVGDLSMRAIAQRAGVGVGSVYDYFGGKGGLLGNFLEGLTGRNFEHLSSLADAGPERALDDVLRGVLAEVVETYLAHPRRTRAAIAIIFRLGQAELVVRERDRFAALVARRVLRDRPDLHSARVHEASRVVMDVGMGIIMAELYRPTDDVHATLVEVVGAVFERLLGEPLIFRATPEGAAQGQIAPKGGRGS